MDKKIKLLFIVFIALTAIAFAPKIKNLITSDEPAKKPDSIDLSVFTPETVQTITIKKGEETKILALKDGKWHINDEIADQNKVSLFFDQLEQTFIGKLASKNQENHSSFEISKENGTVVTFSSENGSNTFVVGKTGPQPESFYIRKEGIANVYLAQGAVQESLAQSAEDWKETPEKTEEATEQADDFEEIEPFE